MWKSIVSLACVALLACSDDDAGGKSPPPGGDNGPYNLIFTGDATYGTAHDGATVYIAIVEDGTGDVVATDDVVITAAGFSFTFTDVLTRGVTYRADYYVDVNADGACVTTDDHMWQLAIAAPTARWNSASSWWYAWMVQRVPRQLCS